MTDLHVDPITGGRAIPNTPDLYDQPPADPQPPVDVEVEAPAANTNRHHTNGTTPPPRTTPRPDTTLPHDLSAEQALLGAALIGGHQTLDHTPPDAFYAPAHGHIAHAIRTLAARSAYIDTTTVAAQLRNDGLLDQAGGTPTLAQLLTSAPSASAAGDYARIVTTHHRARQLIAAARDLEHTVRTQGPDAATQLLTPLLQTSATHPDADRLQPGSWILDAPATPQAVWGTDTEVLWAQGEPCLITGPPGTGKTTLTGQLVHARLGLHDQVLGWPVETDPGRILYLAADRPQQIRRALARCFTEADRHHLDQHLTIWPGPPPTDLARDTSTLIRLAHQAGATTVILDSLKDMAIGLSDDEVGAGLNQAMQLALADGIDVLALHHQRKGTDGKRPKTLEDLYGSTWIAAGAGSILLLWGAAGDPIVELHHLKQPSSDVGPLKVEHDHDTGTSRIHRGFDLHTALRHAPRGLTTLDAARLWLEKDNPNENDRRKAQRRLDTLVRQGKAARSDAPRGGLDGTQPSRYFAVDHHAQETI